LAAICQMYFVDLPNYSLPVPSAQEGPDSPGTSHVVSSRPWPLRICFTIFRRRKGLSDYPNLLLHDDLPLRRARAASDAMPIESVRNPIKPAAPGSFGGSALFPCAHLMSRPRWTDAWCMVRQQPTSFHFHAGAFNPSPAAAARSGPEPSGDGSAPAARAPDCRHRHSSLFHGNGPPPAMPVG
jgi:hypothetical protein